MAKNGEQMERRAAEEQGQGQQRRESPGSSGQRQLEGLPLQSSPYVKYSDLEDYKRQAYGAEGHQPVEEGRGAGATDAPTLSGTNPSSAQAKTVDATHRSGDL